eukprot:TRINITY_DN145_c4_g1_i1.p1 TRINITY_DN145_c4_g1~~TRINITY_DN145_c4_g1_i1.p1  ORF type:complete len:125 (-),score=52.24 TRINITY_DN145_c4_g1_i1:82-456(-)
MSDDNGIERLKGEQNREQNVQKNDDFSNLQLNLTQTFPQLNLQNWVNIGEQNWRAVRSSWKVKVEQTQTQIQTQTQTQKTTNSNSAGTDLEEDINKLINQGIATVRVPLSELVNALVETWDTQL